VVPPGARPVGVPLGRACAGRLADRGWLHEPTLPRRGVFIQPRDARL